MDCKRPAPLQHLTDPESSTGNCDSLSSDWWTDKSCRGGTISHESPFMHCMYVLMGLVYSLRCPFPSIYIQRISCLELWPWRRVECVKGAEIWEQVRGQGATCGGGQEKVMRVRKPGRNWKSWGTNELMEERWEVRWQWGRRRTILLPS